jgi:hypothetical protein
VNLADLQQMAVGIAKETADLVGPRVRRSEEYRPSGFEDTIGLPTVGHPNGQLRGNHLGIRGRGKDHFWLVRGGRATSDEK